MHSELKLDLGRHIVLWIFLVFQFVNLNCCAVFRVEWVVHFLVGVSFRSSVIQSFSATDQKLIGNYLGVEIRIFVKELAALVHWFMAMRPQFQN